MLVGTTPFWLGMLLMQLGGAPLQLASWRWRYSPSAIITFASDNFNRGDANPMSNSTLITWNQAGANIDAGATNINLQSNTIGANSSYGHHVAQAVFGSGTRTTQHYACMKVLSLPQNNDMMAVCAGLSIGGGTANDAVCCGYYKNTPSSDSTYKRIVADDTVVSSTTVGGDNQTYPIWIGVERINSTDFKCWQSTDGTSWTLKQSLTQSSIDDAGHPGILMLGGFDGSFADDFQGGDGNPMTSGWSGAYAGACGTN